MQGNARYGEGTGNIVLHWVGCTGKENSIKDCGFDYSANYDQICKHYQDVGVTCQGLMLLDIIIL